jgi:threonine/homoserine/homoserine lactone efflux protein
MPFLAAMWLGEIVWLAVAVFGPSVMADTFQPMFLMIKWIWVAHLLYLAWKMWRAPTLPVDDRLTEPESSIELFIADFAVTMGNQKTMMFYVALQPTIIDLNAVSVFGW